MVIYDKSYVYDTTRHRFILKARGETEVSSLLSLGQDTLRKYFKRHTILPVFRFLMLDDKENIMYDFSRDVMSASLSVTCQSGQRRTLNVKAANDKGQWKYGSAGRLWVGSRIRFDCGVVLDDVVYWQRQGVFLLQDASPSADGANKTASLTFCDKWGLWDGSVYGATETKTIIPVGVPMRQVFDTIAHEDDGLGEMWDCRPIRFNTRYENTLTTYTIKQEAGQQKAENLTAMANTISSDLFYDARGCLNVESNTLDFMNNNYPVVWRYDEGDCDCGTPSVKYNRSKYYNRITTKGAIVNGYQFKGTAENRNPRSLYNTLSTPVTPKVETNSKLFSDNLCLEQSMYEMVSQTRGLRSVTLTTAFEPFLDVNMAVRISFPSLDIVNETFIIDSVSYSADTDCRMSLSLVSEYDASF